MATVLPLCDTISFRASLRSSAFSLERTRGTWLQIIAIGTQRIGKQYAGRNTSGIGNTPLKFLDSKMLVDTAHQDGVGMKDAYTSVAKFDTEGIPEAIVSICLGGEKRNAEGDELTYRSDSWMSRIVSQVSKPWSTKESRYCDKPSSPKTVSRSRFIQLRALFV